jgi:hypothetical protein
VPEWTSWNLDSTLRLRTEETRPRGGDAGSAWATIPVRISPDLLGRIDEQGRVRSEFIRSAIEYYLYCLDRGRGQLGEQAIALGGCAVQIVDATGRIVASGPVSRAMTAD